MIPRAKPVMSAVVWSSLLCLAVGGLAACKPAPNATTTSISREETVVPVGSAASTSASGLASSTSEVVALSLGPVSCAEEIGATAAESRVKVCRNVSPATHPPCNAANSCAMIEDEIARSCALFDGQTAPMAQCKPDPKSSEAAAAVVKRYYSALNAHDYGTAWQQWGDNGPPNQPMEKFEAGFAHTRSTHVTIGALEPAEGGAGSIYQTVPVVVDATLDTGARQRFTGNYVVRRVNGVDGASAAQLRWHIGEAHLNVTP